MTKHIDRDTRYEMGKRIFGLTILGYYIFRVWKKLWADRVDFLMFSFLLFFFLSFDFRAFTRCRGFTRLFFHTVLVSTSRAMFNSIAFLTQLSETTRCCEGEFFRVRQAFQFLARLTRVFFFDKNSWRGNLETRRWKHTIQITHPILSLALFENSTLLPHKINILTYNK